MFRDGNNGAETESERDFVAFCERQQWAATKLPPSKDQGVRTPDFSVRTLAGYEFIAEVTEFEPEPALEPGEARVRQHTLGNPLRAKLSAKKSQVSQFSDRYATLIVVSAGFEKFAYLDPLSFDSALYGEIAVTTHVPIDPGKGVQFDDETHNAGGRFFTPKHNTGVSAVAALDRRPQTLRVYHNKYARMKLDPARTIFGTTHVEHFVKPDGNAPGWEQVWSSRRARVRARAAR